jgi:hypothetical protein
MKFKGREIYYSALVNEILRETKNGFFYGEGNDEQTQFLGLCEAFLFMWLYSTGDREQANRLRDMTIEQRNREVLTFALENEDEIEAVKPQFVERVKSVMAANVEGTGPGKSL